MRLIKQLAYGLFYLALVLIIGTGIQRLYFTDAPTCFDNIQNQDETGVDCGGGCIDCELKNATINTKDVLLLEAGSGETTLVAEIENPVSYHAIVEYRITAIGRFGGILHSVEEATYIAPNGTRYVVLPGINFDRGDLAGASIEILDKTWEKSLEPGFSALEVTRAEKIITDDSAYVSGSLVNKSPDIAGRSRITILFVDSKGSVVSASAVELKNVKTIEEREFTVFLPESDIDRLKEEGIEMRVFQEVVPNL